jgi:hypothetical protein
VLPPLPAELVEVPALDPPLPLLAPPGLSSVVQPNAAPARLR